MIYGGDGGQLVTRDHSLSAGALCLSGRMWAF